MPVCPTFAGCFVSDGVVNLKGKRYFTVARRVQDFRAACPISDGWGLRSELLVDDGERIVVRGSVVDPEGRVVAVGFAEERRSSRGIHSTSALEVADTSALGRALAAAGFGGDGAYASADEMAAALQGQSRTWSPASRAAFLGRLSALGVPAAAVFARCESSGWGDPASWTDQQRSALLDDLTAGKLPALHTAEGSC